MPDGQIILYTPDGEMCLPALPGLPLSRLIWLEARRFLPEGHPVPEAPSLCAGLGRCGACRARFLAGAPEVLDSEREVLSAALLAEGWRLLCRHEAADGMRIELPRERLRTAPRVERISFSSGGGASGTILGGEPGSALCVRLAVDFGTTGVAWQALEHDGTVVADGAFANPQAGAGADVVSRIQAALQPEGAALLQRISLDALAAVVRRLEENGATVESMCLAANPAITYILSGCDVSGLAAAPYHLHAGRGGQVEDFSLGDVILPTYLPPFASPFVGGDVTAGLAWLLHEKRPVEPFVLADLGTNGELLLQYGEQCLAASVALGPALEGIGLSCGGAASPGAVAGVRLVPDGLKLDCIAGYEGPPTHLCATGYLSLLHCLLKAGLLDDDGHFVMDAKMPLARRLAGHIRKGQSDREGQGELRLYLTDDIFCSASDIEELLKAKAAFSLGLAILLDEAGLAPADVACIYLAGALGEHAPVGDLAALGFIPKSLETRCRAVGNSSLAGAALLVRQPALRAELERRVTACREIVLAGNSAFTSGFFAHMRFGNMVK